MSTPTWFYRPAPMLDLGLRALNKDGVVNSTERMESRPVVRPRCIPVGPLSDMDIGYRMDEVLEAHRGEKFQQVRAAVREAK